MWKPSLSTQRRSLSLLLVKKRNEKPHQLPCRKHQSSSDVETSQVICSENQLTGLYIIAT